MIGDVSTSRRASTADAPDAYWRRLGCRQDPCATLAPGSVFAGPGFVQLQHALFKALRTSPGGLTLLTGAEGVGKTTLLQTIVDALRTVGETVIFHRCGPDRQLLEADLAAVADDRGKRNPILLLDGADAWDDAAVAAFERALTRTEGPPLAARIVVVFRQDNDPRLNRVTSLALATGIPFARLRVEPLEAGSAGDFLLHRMRAAGYTAGLPLDAATMARIETESGGLPSRLLVLASVELARIAEPRSGRGTPRAKGSARGTDFSTIALRLAVGAAALAALVGGGVGLLLSPSVQSERNDATASAAMRTSPAPSAQATSTPVAVQPPTALAVAPIPSAPPPGMPASTRDSVAAAPPPAAAIAAAVPTPAPAPPTVVAAPRIVEPTLVPLTGATPVPAQALPRDVRGAIDVLERTADAVLAPASGSAAPAPPAIVVSPTRAPDEPLVTIADEDESIVARVLALHDARREALVAAALSAPPPVVAQATASAPPAPPPPIAPIVVETHGDPSLDRVVVQPAPVVPQPPPPPPPRVVVIEDPAAAVPDGEGVVVHVSPAAGPPPLVTEDALPPAEGVVVQAPPPAPVAPQPPPPPVVTAPHFDPPPPAVVIAPPPVQPPPAQPATAPTPPVVSPPPAVVVAPAPPQPQPPPQTVTVPPPPAVVVAPAPPQPPPQAVPTPPPPARVPAPTPAVPPTPQPPPAAVAPPPVVVPAPPAAVPPPPPAPPAAAQRSAPAPSPAAIAQAVRDLERGEAMLATGDIAAARLFFERAANAGNRRAMTALARTYDPDVLRQLGVVGLTPDPQRAQFWYRRAAEPTR